MSFATNENQQISLYDPSFFLTDRERRMLEKSWAVPFGELVFPAIDEKPFAVLYSAAWAPAEVHVLWGLAAAGGAYLALSWLFRAFSAEELSFIARKKFRKRRTG